MPRNHPKTYTKPPNSGYDFKHIDLALLETWARHCQKDRVKRRQTAFTCIPATIFKAAILFSVIPHFKFQFSKSIKSSTFYIFLILTCPLRKKKSLFPKMPRNHPKIYTKPPNSDYDYKHGDLALLDTWARYWQKGRVKRRPAAFTPMYPRTIFKAAILFSEIGSGNK